MRPGLGWDRTLQKALRNDLCAAGGETELERAYREHVLCGEKSLRLYRAEPAVLAAARNALAQLTPRASAAASQYPLLLSDEQIQEASEGVPELVAVVPHETGLAAVFSCIRSFEIRENLEPTALPREVASALGSFSKLIRVRVQRAQTFDVVWLPHHGNFVDVRIDMPFSVSAEAAGTQHEQIRRIANALIQTELLQEPLNLFPAIDRIYRTPNEGSVVEMAFTTTTASVKYEKMRRRHLCLREEIYHRAGTTALNGEIEPFRLAVEWALDKGSNITSRPELNLYGRSSTLLARVQFLHEAVIRSCMDVADFEHIRDRIIAYV